MTPTTEAAAAVPLRVMFLHTSLDIGGAETITLNLIRRLDRTRFAPVLCCLKEPGALGEMLAAEIPVFSHILSGKYDLRVLPRLANLMRRERIDGVLCVGAGDKMFWGRLAARLAGVPVIACAIHSTGWPDRIGRLNRWLTPITDRFVGVADTHGRYLIEEEGFPAAKVCVISNGIDTDRFHPRGDDPAASTALRQALGLGTGPIAGTVARLGPEKNHAMFLEVAAECRREAPDAQFLLVGDGPLKETLQERARQLDIADCVHFLGWRRDVPDLLRLMDAFLLTSHMEANPVSILEALASGVPVISTRVGSIAESVGADAGFLVDPGDATAMSAHLVRLFRDPQLVRTMGTAARATVLERWSIETMVRQYEEMFEDVYNAKRGRQPSPRRARTEEVGIERVQPEQNPACP